MKSKRFAIVPRSFVKVKRKNRLALIGLTEESRLLTIILENKGNGEYHPITAYPTTQSDAALYKRLQGGKK